MLLCEKSLDETTSSLKVAQCRGTGERFFFSFFSPKNAPPNPLPTLLNPDIRLCPTLTTPSVAPNIAVSIPWPTPLPTVAAPSANPVLMAPASLFEIPRPIPFIAILAPPPNPPAICPAPRPAPLMAWLAPVPTARGIPQKQKTATEIEGEFVPV